MAYIYQYDIKRHSEEETLDLTAYSDVLESAISEYFGKNLKEVYVERDYFEFRLYRSVSNGKLRNLGKVLKRRVAVPFGFRRRKHSYYLIVDRVDEENGMVDVDVVDVLIGQGERYRQRVERYFERVQDNVHNELSENLRNNLYLDVLSATVSKKMLCKDEQQEVREGDCFLLQAQHRKFVTQIERGADEREQFLQIDYVPEYRYLAMEEKAEEENEEIDYFVVNQSRITKEDDAAQRIQEMLSLQLEEATEIAEEDVSGNILEFCVHNVGQALATSIALQGDTPFLYFDYGLPYAGNALTKPTGVNLPIKERGIVILSHLDKDHWNGLSEFVDGYKAKWYIPVQPVGVGFGRKISEIIAAGGEVHRIPAGVRNCWGGKLKLSCGGTSTVNAARIGSTKHETGMAMRIEAEDELGNDFHILIEGDQDYDYVENAFLADVDLLVACHHGGKYSWTAHSALPVPRNANSMVVYSYGFDNTHGHPTQVDKHRLAGWRAEHETIDGEYMVRIQI